MAALFWEDAACVGARFFEERVDIAGGAPPFGSFRFLLAIVYKNYTTKSCNRSVARYSAAYYTLKG